MKKVISLLLIIPFLLIAATTIYNNVKVIGISDGDTIKILKDGKTVRIRLYGIDTPEKNQEYGQKAKQFTSNLVYGKHVTIRVHDTDRYGRIVGEVILSNGTNLNDELVKNGFAWWYKRYAPKSTKLKEFESMARLNKLGLWQDKSPTPPWDFRKGKKKNKVSYKTRSNSDCTDCYWCTKSSRKRHNSGCRYYQNSKGYKCGKSSGIACKICGG